MMLHDDDFIRLRVIVFGISTDTKEMLIRGIQQQGHTCEGCSNLHLAAALVSSRAIDALVYDVGPNEFVGEILSKLELLCDHRFHHDSVGLPFIAISDDASGTSRIGGVCGSAQRLSVCETSCKRSAGNVCRSSGSPIEGRIDSPD
jgi:hypothetical protein